MNCATRHQPARWTASASESAVALPRRLAFDTSTGRHAASRRRRPAPLGPLDRPLAALTLGLVSSALITRFTRASMLDVLSQDYVTTARSKGLRERNIIVRHGLRNAMFPVLTVIGILIGRILSGAFIVETIFNIPGIGRLGVTAVLQRDYPVILGSTLSLAFAFLISTFVVDLLYGLLDPRIRVSDD